MKRGLLVLLPAALACGGTSPQSVQLREAVARTGAPLLPGVAFRMPAGRGATKLYDLPGLEAVEARFETGPGIDDAVGFSADDDLIYSLAGRNLVVLDLRSGRVRTLDSNVTAAAMSQAGSVVLARSDGSLAVASDRRVEPVGELPADGRLEALWGTAGGRTVAVVRGDSGRTLLVLDGGPAARRTPLPDGPMGRTRWGDAVAIAGLDAIEVREILRDGPVLRIPLRRSVQAVTFSASGHRLYAATDLPSIQVFERYQGDALDEYPLPGPVRALRADAFGRYVFGNAGERLIVLDLVQGTATAVAGTWNADLPAAGPDGTLLLEQRDTVVAMVPGDTAPRGLVALGARDHWLVAPWSTQRQTLAVIQPDVAGAGAGGAGQEIFVQVSSTSNAQWAEGLASDLRLAGMRAAVLPPSADDEMYRVVLGPYATRDEAEEIGRKLGMPYWIFQRDTVAQTAP